MKAVTWLTLCTELVNTDRGLKCRNVFYCTMLPLSGTCDSYVSNTVIKILPQRFKGTSEFLMGIYNPPQILWKVVCLLAYFSKA